MRVIVVASGAIAAAAFLAVMFATGDDHRYSAEIRRTPTHTCERRPCRADNPGRDMS
jgi:hypothetical protein